MALLLLGATPCAHVAPEATCVADAGLSAPVDAGVMLEGCIAPPVTRQVKDGGVDAYGCPLEEK